MLFLLNSLLDLLQQYNQDNLKLKIKIKFDYTVQWFIYAELDKKRPLSVNLVKKYPNCLFQLKFSTNSNSNMLYSIAMLTFAVLYWKGSFWVDLVQKFRSFCLWWNFVELWSNLKNSMAIFIFVVLDWKFSLANLI